MIDRMVATLVIGLPSIYEGGELIVTHEGSHHAFRKLGERGLPFPVGGESIPEPDRVVGHGHPLQGVLRDADPHVPHGLGAVQVRHHKEGLPAGLALGFPLLCPSLAGRLGDSVG